MTNTTNKKSQEKTLKIKVWENLQLLCLFGTILGQILVGGLYFVAQSIWLACNILALSRDFALHRPIADKVKNAGLCGVTVALIILRVMGIYQKRDRTMARKNKVYILLNTRTLQMQVFSKKNKALFWLGVLSCIDGKQDYKLIMKEVE